MASGGVVPLASPPLPPPPDVADCGLQDEAVVAGPLPVDGVAPESAVVDVCWGATRRVGPLDEHAAHTPPAKTIRMAARDRAVTVFAVRRRLFAPGRNAVRAGLTCADGATIRVMVALQVVVVEDDQGIGASLARTLEGQGYEVTWVTTAAEGLA